MNYKRDIIFTVLILLSACSNRDIYEAVQHNQKLKCEKLPPAQYEECMEQAGESYESYERRRKQEITPNK